MSRTNNFLLLREGLQLCNVNIVRTIVFVSTLSPQLGSNA